MKFKILCQICLMACRSFSFSLICVLTHLTDSNGGNLCKLIFIYYKQPLNFFFGEVVLLLLICEVQGSDIDS